MNTNTAVVVGIIAVLVVIGGIFLYMQSNTPAAAPVTTTTTTTTTGSDNTGTTPTSQTQQPGAPSASTNSSVFAFDTKAVVSGTTVPNGAFTSYWFEYGTTVQMTSKTSAQLVGSGYVAEITPAYIGGLTKDTTYYFRLVAQNQYGTTQGAQYTFATNHDTLAPVGSLPTTQTVAANAVSRTTATINGAVTPNKNATSYWFEYGQSANLGNTTALQLAGDGTAKVAASFSLSNLTPATTYYFRLNAQNQFGTVNGAILHFTTSGPVVSVALPVVTTQLPSPIGTTTATVRGTVNPYSAQTTYWFEYSTDSGFGSSLLKTTSHGSAGAGATTVSVEAAITGLRANTTYYYRIVAQNAAGTVRGDTKSVATK